MNWYDNAITPLIPDYRIGSPSDWIPVNYRLPIMDSLYGVQVGAVSLACVRVVSLIPDFQSLRVRVCVIARLPDSLGVALPGVRRREVWG